ERPGAMFADWELIGVPVRITIGDRSLKDGKVEVVQRRGLQMSAVAVADAASHVAGLLRG
ncbi:MAG TPA: His/Gly/Thr/Pro-type tRNA ligase C-terminal domain-containing protein, partial [Burkholderiaceae bacterium]|nr:His/Gly/Thr/Pro-type tRNA ligase C-terminal domain-containing protein [Burkholderiaceae bacterium]